MMLYLFPRCLCSSPFKLNGFDRIFNGFDRTFRLFLSVCEFVGRALEELRSSLYNELKTSEGAKRQQQRFCGPVVAMSFNFVVAVGIILANKLVIWFLQSQILLSLFFIYYVIVIVRLNCAGDGKSWIQFPNLSNIDSLYRGLDSFSFLQVSLFASNVSSIKDNTFLISFLSWSCHGLCFWTR